MLEEQRSTAANILRLIHGKDAYCKQSSTVGERKEKINPLRAVLEHGQSVFVCPVHCSVIGLLKLVSVYSSRSLDQPHGDGDGDRCSDRLHSLHPPQCRLPDVLAAEKELENSS